MKEEFFYRVREKPTTKALEPMVLELLMPSDEPISVILLNVHIPNDSQN